MIVQFCNKEQKFSCVSMDKMVENIPMRGEYVSEKNNLAKKINRTNEMVHEKYFSYG